MTGDEGTFRRPGRRGSALAMSSALIALAVVACSVAPGASSSEAPAGAIGQANMSTVSPARISTDLATASPTAEPTERPTETPAATTEPSVEPVPTRTPTTEHAGALPILGRAPGGRWTGVEWIAGRVPVPDETGDGWMVRFSAVAWSKGYIGFWNVSTLDGEAQVTTYETTSVDGLRWTPLRTIAHPASHSAIVGVIEARGVLLAVAEPWGVTCGAPAVSGLWRSADGATWQPVDVAKTFGDSIVANISAGSAGFLATGVSGASASSEGKAAVWTSRDGISWTSSNLPDRFVLGGGVSFAGGFVLAGTTLPPEYMGCGGGVLAPSIYWSPDGSAWSLQDLPGSTSGTNVSMSVCRITDTTLLAIETVADGQTGPDLESAWYSKDGRTWTKRPDAWTYGWVWTDGVHAILARDGSLFAVDEQLNLFPIAQHGDRTGDGWGVIGPTGILMANGDGHFWMGVPTAG